jgi:hypothetical protein
MQEYRSSPDSGCPSGGERPAILRTISLSTEAPDLKRGGEIENEPIPVAGAWDLAIAHTLHPGFDYSWLSGTPLVLDATYQLPALPQRHVL